MYFSHVVNCVALIHFFTHVDSPLQELKKKQKTVLSLQDVGRYVDKCFYTHSHVEKINNMKGEKILQMLTTGS